MPIIQVQILEGRSDKQIQELISNLTNTAVISLNVKPQQVRVLINVVPKKHWGIGGITVKELEDQDG